MDYVLLIAAITLLVAAVVAGWLLTLLGMPGNWVMVGAAALYAWLVPAAGVAAITWTSVVVMAALAAVGELAEFGAGVWGTRKAGGSRRAAVFSLIGSMIGAIVGAALGLPIPVLGSAVAAVLGGALGALAGAGFAEHTLGEDSRQSFRVGGAAFVGRLLGTGAKTFVATILAVMTIVSLFL
ncbi:MAG: DUF456 domain-containing protein [Planctomycetota bacterium]